MLNWLADYSTVVFTILGAVALVVLVIAWMNRDREVPIGSRKDRRKEPRSLNALALGGIVVLLLALLAGGVWLIDYLIMSDEEQMVHAVQEMAAGVMARDTERVFTHVSDSFHGPNGQNKREFKEFARRYIERGEVQSLPVWDFVFADVSRTSRSGTVLFLFKVRGSIAGSTPQDMFYRCESKFRLDPDDRWRLEGFRFLNPVNNEPIPVPY